MLAGGRRFSGANDFVLARLTTNLVLDQSFGNNGVTATFADGSNVRSSGVKNIAVQPDSKIILVGNQGNNFTLARYYYDRTPDTSFGAGGHITTDLTGAGDILYGLMVQSDGRIVASGLQGLARYQESVGPAEGLAGTPALAPTPPPNPDGCATRPAGRG